SAETPADPVSVSRNIVNPWSTRADNCRRYDPSGRIDGSSFQYDGRRIGRRHDDWTRRINRNRIYDRRRGLRINDRGLLRIYHWGLLLRVHDSWLLNLC